MLDPIVVAIGVGLLVSIVAGRALISALEFVAPRWRKPAEWLVVGDACLIAILGDLWSEGPGTQGALAFVIASLPGLLAYLVFRTPYASAVVSLLPLYFIINSGAQGRTLHMPAIAVDRMVPVQPPGWSCADRSTSSCFCRSSSCDPEGYFDGRCRRS